MADWKLDLKRNKDGIIIGMLAGLAATIWLKAQGADLSFAVATSGLLDNTLRSVGGVANLAITKVGLSLMIIFGSIGYLIDRLVYPRK